MNRIILFCLSIILLLPGSSLGKTLEIKYFQTHPRYEYRVKLLELALDKAVGLKSVYQLRSYGRPVTQARGMALLAGNEVDVAFLATNQERENKYLPIRIPILREILGYRVFLIHEDSKERFTGVTDFEQLRKDFRAGFGSHWADYEILKANRINVVSVATYENLFKMLMKKRFDYFPRGINEAWDEVENKNTTYPALMVEENLAFYYPFPIYFFVNKTNRQLADTIEKGLKIALEDGSFKEMFLKYHQAVIGRASLENRRLFKLKNPTLPDSFSGIDTNWWLKER